MADENKISKRGNDPVSSSGTGIYGPSSVSTSSRRKRSSSRDKNRERERERDNRDRSRDNRDRSRDRDRRRRSRSRSRSHDSRHRKGSRSSGWRDGGGNEDGNDRRSGMHLGGGYMSVDSGPKESKELFVGNLNTSAPGGLTPEMIMSFMNNALRQVGLVTRSNEPITGCRINTKFCFIEFDNMEDCTNAMNLNGLPFLGNCLNIKRPAKYAGPEPPHKTWQEMTGMIPPDDPAMRDRPTGGNMDAVTQDATKNEREIYVGGTQSDITDFSLKEFLSNALHKMGLTVSSVGSPIVQVRVNTTFCFVVFRTREEAANVLNLNGIPFNNVPLKISRPAKLNLGGLYQSYNWNELLAGWQTGQVKLMTAGPPTKVVRLTNMITAVELNDPMQHKEVLDDVTNECSNFGRVVGVIAPRPGDGPNGGIGQVFVEMSTDEQAKLVLCALKGRMFDGRIVDAKFYPYEFYMLGNYGLILPTLVVTRSGPVTVDMALLPPGSQPVVPMGLPMGQPMGLPMGQPMGLPMGQPMVPAQPFPRPFP